MPNTDVADWLRRAAPAFVAAAGLLVAAGMLGYQCSRSQLGAQRAEIAALKRSNQELRESFTPLEEGLRGGRQPLERRIEELEAELAEARADEPEPKPARAAAPPARLRELELSVARLERERGESQRSGEKLAAENRTLQKRLAALESEKERLESRIASLSVPKPAPPPVASARPAAPAAPAEEAAATAAEPEPVCARIEEPEFRITAKDTPHYRFGRTLALRLIEDQDGLFLALGPSARPRYALEEPPQRFSYDCQGTPYIVSVCRVSRAPLEVAGRITPADAWRGACGDARTAAARAAEQD